MRLTRKKALEICAELWDWLWEHPLVKHGEDAKGKWPGWKKHGHMDSWCPCCEYDASRLPTKSCSRCPIPKTAWTKTEKRVCYCTADDSPFYKWVESRKVKTRKKYAKIIRDAARKELRKLKRKAKK